MMSSVNAKELVSGPHRALAITTENGRASGANGDLRPHASDPMHDRNGQPEGEPKPAAYNFAILALFVLAVAGTAAAVVGGERAYAPAVIAAAVTLGIGAGTLAGVVLAQWKRANPLATVSGEPFEEAVEKVEAPAAESAEAKTEEAELAARWRFLYDQLKSRTGSYLEQARRKLHQVPLLPAFAIGNGVLGLAGTWYVLRNAPYESWISMWFEIGSAGACLAVAALAATALRYLETIDPAVLPEAPGLARGARVIAWVWILAALSFGALWTGQYLVSGILNGIVLAINAFICVGLIRAGWQAREGTLVYPAEVGAVRILGSRNNILGSILDSAEQQLGIDLRSTWALTVVRTSVEPLIICLFLVGWLSTSFTIVGLEEQGLNQRFGVSAGAALDPGLHIHLPWPIDRVHRVPVKRMQELNVGHEGTEEPGPENVLWAVEHAPNEYTLLLGNGRDLITIDAGVAYRIVDSKAWQYHMQNPAQALKAIAYRAVMRNTVNKTLQEALSENVAILTVKMRDMVQEDADALGLGVRVEAFTLGGMHPPVPVAKAYQAVISAEVGKNTAIVNAQVYRNRTVPLAESQILKNKTRAEADGDQARATAAGQAWSFRTLESQFRSAPEEFRFRRRLEQLEQGLSGRGFTVVDSRFQRDGGELWLTQ
ncbi:MAG TPA: protease modulator HflK [Bryobacteraceae bacterium]|jgi:regulator of protease activity HflC (stomatin/prohibitin superfamily)|nr:protease modulator HflK [Bryobacteraceae bacterium]